MSNELLLAETGTGLSATMIMSSLSTNRPLTQRMVATTLRQTEANVSRQLQVMKKQGLVNVRQNRKDKRQKEVVLTAKGKRVRDKGLNLLDKQQKDVLKMVEIGEARAFGKTVDNLVSGLALN